MDNGKVNIQHILQFSSSWELFELSFVACHTTLSFNNYFLFQSNVTYLINEKKEKKGT